MQSDCTCCIAVRFLNPAGEAVSGVHWVNKDILDLSTIRILVRSGEVEEFRNYDILKISTAMIGAFLVKDVQIGPHDNRPKSAVEILQAWWLRTQPIRHAFPVLSVLVGAVLALALVLIGQRGLSALGILDHPMASMVWLWAYLGSQLGNVVILLTLAFTGLLIFQKQYVIAGFSFVAGVALAILANDVAETILEAIPLDANWPDSYLFLGDELKLAAKESLMGWGDWIDPVWPALTVLLNALGLTVAAELVNKLLPLMTGIKLEPSATTVQPAPRTPSARRPVSRGPVFTTLNIDRPDISDLLADASPKIDDEPFIDADLKALDEVPLEVPEKPFYC